MIYNHFFLLLIEPFVCLPVIFKSRQFQQWTIIIWIPFELEWIVNCEWNKKNDRVSIVIGSSFNSIRFDSIHYTAPLNKDDNELFIHSLVWIISFRFVSFILSIKKEEEKEKILILATLDDHILFVWNRPIPPQIIHLSPIEINGNFQSNKLITI